MKSLSILIPNKSMLKLGFTLIETLIVIGILSFLAIFSMVIGLDSYERYNLRSDLDKAAILLQKARGSALNNMGASPHGVYFGLPDKFVIFQGAHYGDNPSLDIPVDKSKSVIVTGDTEIVFDALSGQSVGGTVTVSNGIQNIKIEVNTIGAIDW